MRDEMARYDDRRLVGVQAERVSNVSSSDFPGHYAGEDHSWNLKKFKKVRFTCRALIIQLLSAKQNLKVKVQRLSQHSIEFDIAGVDASIANAFRRIMIAEVISCLFYSCWPSRFTGAYYMH